MLEQLKEKVLRANLALPRYGPFTWGTDPDNAVHNAVVLEEVACMAYRTEALNPSVPTMQQELLEKHYFRKHGANAYYGQK